jgi:hypothetical protein
MEAFLGQFGAAELAFTREALDAAGIEYVVRAYQPDALSSQALVPPSKFDMFVAADRLADAKAAIVRWEKEAEEAVMRDCDAPRATPEELAADAEWERQKQEDAKRDAVSIGGAASALASRLWLPAIILAIVGTLLAWLLN